MELGRLKLARAAGNYNMREKIVLRPSGWHVDYVFSAGRLMLCEKGLRKYFDFPKHTNVIDVVLDDEPGEDRVRLSCLSDQNRSVRVDGRRVDIYPSFEEWLFCHMPESGVCYARVEYGAGGNR